MMQTTQYRHVDPATGRELIVYGNANGQDDTATIAIYRTEATRETCYYLELPRDEVARLALALAASAHPQGGH